MFQSTLSSLITKLTSSTVTELRGTVQFVISTVQGLSCEFILLYQNCVTHREPGNGPSACGAVQVKLSSLALTNMWIEIRGSSLWDTLPRFPFCLHYSPRWENSFTSQMRLFNLSELQGVSHRGHRRLSVNHQQKLSVIPTDQTLFTFRWLSLHNIWMRKVFLLLFF